MTDKELNIALREMARQAGLCDPWYDAWKDDDSMDKCLTRFVKGFDFACEKNYPPLDFMRQHFGDKKGLIHKHHIFLDEEVNIDPAENSVYIFLGDCSGTVCFRDRCVCDVYLRHKSEIGLYSFGMSKVFVSLYDESRCSSTVSFAPSVLKFYDKRNGLVEDGI